MTPSLSLANASTMSVWRRASTSLALAASLAFAFQPTLLLAQVGEGDIQPPPKVEAKPKPKKRTSPTDKVSDDLNRREAERAAGIVREITSAPKPATAPATNTNATGASVPQAANTNGTGAPLVPPAAAKKRTSPTDKVSDDLNRREAERAAGVVREIAGAPKPATPPASTPATGVPQSLVPPAAAAAAAAVGSAPAPGVKQSAGSEPTTVAALPPRAPIVSTSLTPTINTQPGAEPASTGAAGTPNAPAMPKVQETQARPPTQPPVPVQPPAAGTPATPPPAAGAGVPTRSFAQSQLVPTQQPTLNLEVGKGTAIKLPGPATTVFVAAPDIADVQVKSPGMIYVFAKKPGDTVLYAVDDQDRVLLNTIVTVNSPFSRMKTTLDQQHPGNGVSFDNQNDAIVLSGTVRSAVVAEDARKIAAQYTSNAKVINNIKVDAPTQVQLRVKVAEVNRGSLKRVGINWQNINNIALFGYSPAIGFATSTITATGGQVPGSAQVVGQSTLNNPSLSAVIDLLATQNQATILAEPNLVAMSGETASFLAGEEIPVIQPQAGGVTNTITVAYKQVGISIAFTPTILGERINLKVAPEVSQITTQGQVSVPITATATVVIPAIETRKAATTVEIGSGQSFAIAGLLNSTSQQTITKVPWAGDNPVLGSLCNSAAYQPN